MAKNDSDFGAYFTDRYGNIVDVPDTSDESEKSNCGGDCDCGRNTPPMFRKPRRKRAAAPITMPTKRVATSTSLPTNRSAAPSPLPTKTPEPHKPTLLDEIVGLAVAVLIFTAVEFLQWGLEQTAMDVKISILSAFAVFVLLVAFLGNQDESNNKTHSASFIEYLEVVVQLFTVPIVVYLRLNGYPVVESICIPNASSFVFLSMIHIYNDSESAQLLSYVYEFLASVLVYISDKFATLDIRVAKYQNLDNYLVIFHILGGLFGFVYWSVRQEVLKNLLYVQAVVFAYQVIRYAYYHVYPELVRAIMKFIELVCPLVFKLIRRIITTVEWACKIALVSFKIWWASAIYAIKLVGLFWIPILSTVAVIVACVLAEV